MPVIDVVSPSDGTFAFQHVDDGTEVAQGDPICGIEIMKMENSVYAPAAGIIRFRLPLGELVSEGDVVAVIET